MAKQENLTVRILNFGINENDIAGRKLYASCGDVNNEEYSDRIIIPPKTSELIPVGITFTIPDNYTLKIELNEELIDSSILYIGHTFAPGELLNELGIMVYNCGKQVYVLDDLEEFAKFYFVKQDNLTIDFLLND